MYFTETISKLRLFTTDVQRPQRMPRDLINYIYDYGKWKISKNQ